MVDQLHAVAVIDVVVSGQLFGVADALRDDGCKLNRAQIITAVKARVIAPSGIQESPVQIIRQVVGLTIKYCIKPENTPPGPHVPAILADAFYAIEVTVSQFVDKRMILHREDIVVDEGESYGLLLLQEVIEHPVQGCTVRHSVAEYSVADQLVDEHRNGHIADLFPVTDRLNLLSCVSAGRIVHHYMHVALIFYK